MKKITAIAIVLLACALLLGVGGGFLLTSENIESTDGEIPTPTLGGASPTVYFDCPPEDPNCHP